jgi:hypothetical protein
MPLPLGSFKKELIFIYDHRTKKINSFLNEKKPNFVIISSPNLGKLTMPYLVKNFLKWAFCPFQKNKNRLLRSNKIVKGING